MLHDAWWIWVLRPNSVSNGWTERQFDTRPQSPQPSHRRSLMSTRVGGSSSRPRLRFRRFSAAHSWSWMRTVTPGTRASASWASRRRRRSHTSAPGASRAPA